MISLNGLLARAAAGEVVPPAAAEDLGITHKEVIGAILLAVATSLGHRGRLVAVYLDITPLGHIRMALLTHTLMPALPLLTLAIPPLLLVVVRQSRIGLLLNALPLLLVFLIPLR